MSNDIPVVMAPGTHPNDPKIEVGEYPKNTRYSVEKGTKFIQVQIGFYWDQSPWKATERATKLAFQTARSRWGQFPHDEIDYTVIVLTAQVMIELRWRQL